MHKLFLLYDELRNANVSLFDFQIPNHPAATVELDGTYGVFIDTGQIRSIAEETYLVAHEAGHVMTGATHQIYSPLQLVAQHENRADRWAIRKLIPRNELTAALQSGFTEPWQLAEYFDLPEEFICKAVDYYQNIRPL